MSLRRILPITGAALALSLPLAPPASAAWAGRNGSVFYTQYTTTPLGPKDVELHGDIRAINPDGTDDRVIVGTDADESAPAPSPDGQRLAFIRDTTLWFSAIDGSAATKSVPAEDTPSWFPNGRSVVFAEDTLFTGIRAIDLGATYTPVGKPRKIITARGFKPGRHVLTFAGAPQITPDGRTLIYTRVEAHFAKRLDLSLAIWAARADGTGRHELIHGTGDFQEAGLADISPDGQHVAFLGTRSAKVDPRRIFVANIDGTGVRLVATAPAGHSSYDQLSWSPDGTRLVVARNESDSKRGGSLELIDPVTGAATTLKTVATGELSSPKWARLP